jgi:chitinase
MKQALQRFIIILIGFLAYHNSALAQQKVAGYYEGRLNLPAVDKMEFQNLTHVIQAFAYPNPDGSISFSSGVPNADLITAVHLAKEKILISFQNDSTNGFGTIAADSSIRAVFISNVVQFLRTNQYDGIDIDWEFPTYSQGKQLTELVIELRQKFNQIDSTWLITMAVPPTYLNGQNFQYSDMAAYIDWFSIMGYNFNGSWSGLTGHNAPLYSSPRHNNGDDSSSIEYMTKIRQVPASKLLLGVPFYGTQFYSKGLYQTFTDTVINPTYADIENLVFPREWIYNWDTVSEVPYYTNKDSTIFITFDDTISIRLKTEYSISQKLGGIMIWALDQDLVNNSQPLLETIGQVIHNNPTQVEPRKQTNQSIIQGYYLYNNYPNPFNPSTTINYSIPKTSFVTIKVYDILGKEKATLVNEEKSPGNYSVQFSLKGSYASGVFFYRMQAGSFVETKKLILMK